MARRTKGKGDVSWILPGKKKPIAYSTQATSDLIVCLSQEYDTIAEVRSHITYDVEAKAILDKYIEKGCGNLIARNLFR